MSINLVILQGNLGKDPELRYFDDGTPIATFSLATNEPWKDRTSGNVVEHTEWHRIVAKRRTAEIAKEFLKSGSPVFIEGKNRTRKYDKDGVNHYVTEVLVTKLTLMGGKSAEDDVVDEEVGLDPKDL